MFKRSGVVTPMKVLKKVNATIKDKNVKDTKDVKEDEINKGK